MSDELEEMDALGVAERIRAGDVTETEVLDATIQRIEARNPQLNAVVATLYDEAREAIGAGLPDGPFRGVPYLFKELVVSVRGAATTLGSRLYEHNRSTAESELVRRCRAAGLVVVGKTNSSEFGLQPVTEPHLFGPTRNPWNLEYSPGGSSGGSAAAVAAGILPMAHATDGGGSIRIPASCCGLFGLKPTRARITAGPEGGEGMAGLASQHAVTWSVRDSAALLDATAGPLPGDPYAPAPPARPYLQEAREDPARLRVAFSTTAPNGANVDPECAEAVREAARLCEGLGHHVEEASPDFDVAAAEAGFAAVFQANTMVNVGRATGGVLPEEGLIEPLTRAVAERGLAMPAPDYIRSLQAIHRESRRIAAFFENHDVWLTPTLATPPPRTGYYDSDITDVGVWMQRLMEFIPFTWISNVTGQPAMSVPFALSRDGLPLGIHFAARSGEEGLLFALAGQIERARPWTHMRPG
ncbi:amidase [Aquibium oceanicum]|uniref:Indoleacetamide hydrolase n=1 Tax=Aquibium oceanicum TaxID=1670800 RepID=A0A1L3ST07_9HYPH|nr:amidase [Aquibium oceanicum]APH72524.1 amidase [Aquibium oceanicum]